MSVPLSLSGDAVRPVPVHATPVRREAVAADGRVVRGGGA